MTILDNHTIELMEGNHWVSTSPFGRFVKRNAFFQQWKNSFGMLTLGRNIHASWYNTVVFYDIDYFRNRIEDLGFKVLQIGPEAHDYQTVVVLGLA